MTATKEIPPLSLVESEGRDAARWYLAAMIDGEGWVSHPPTAPQISISNTQVDIIYVIERCLDILDIYYTTGGPYHNKNPMYKPSYSIRLGFRAESISKAMNFDRYVIRRILADGGIKIRSHSEAVGASNRRRRAHA